VSPQRSQFLTVPCYGEEFFHTLSLSRTNSSAHLCCVRSSLSSLFISTLTCVTVNKSAERITSGNTNEKTTDNWVLILMWLNWNWLVDKTRSQEIIYILLQMNKCKYSKVHYEIMKLWCSDIHSSVFCSFP
jgi:hypothetical protein